MEIKTLTPAQLKTFIRTDEFKTMPVIPISTHRALSHCVNPRVEADDVIMLLAYEGEKMVGYLGVLADRIFNDSGSFKCGWLSCMWVDPNMRGKGIAKQLLATAFSTWQNHILVTEFTPEAKALYDRSKNFDDLRTNTGLRCFMRFNVNEILPSKRPGLKPLIPLLKLGDAFGNFANSLRLPWIRPKIKTAFRWLPVEEIDTLTGDFIEKVQTGSFEKRGAAELNWILKNPWLKVSAPTTESARYHFSSIAKQFKNLCFVAYNEKNEPNAFLFFSLRNGHLKIPYALFDAKDAGEIVSKIYEIIFQEQVNMLTVFHPQLVQYFSNNSTPFIYKRRVLRNYIVTKALSQYFANRSSVVIRDGDADCAFT